PALGLGPHRPVTRSRGSCHEGLRRSERDWPSPGRRNAVGTLGIVARATSSTAGRWRKRSRPGASRLAAQAGRVSVHPMDLVTELDTPAVTIRMDIVERNIRRVHGHLARHGIANRPHVKTHKIPALGRLQMAAGAIGITCQKLGEVEVFTE